MGKSREGKISSTKRMLLLASLYFRLVGSKNVTEEDMEDLNTSLNLVKRTAVLGMAVFMNKWIWSNIRNSDLRKAMDPDVPLSEVIQDFSTLVWDKKSKLSRYSGIIGLRKDLEQVVKLARLKVFVTGLQT